MSGTSSDDTAVTTVTWSNNRGGSGTATGTTSWSFTATGLSSGHNIITVDAADAAGNHGTDSIDVTYTPVSGSTYYVSTSGSDSADGSIGAPWKTLQTSIGKMVSGDTLYLRAGTFSDPDVPDINNFTAAGTPTRFLGYPGEKVILNGPGTNSGACGIFNSANVTWGDMTISNFNIALIVFGASHEIVLTNLTIWQIGQQGLFVYDASYNVLVTNALIRDTGRYPGRNGEGMYVGLGQPGGDATHSVVISQIVVSNTTDEAIEFKQGSYSNILENFVISHGAQSTSEGAVELDEDGNYNLSPNHIVRNGIIHDYGGWSFGVHMMTGSTLYNVVLYNRGSAVPIKLEETVADTWLRSVYNNTIDGGTITVTSTQSILTNNIGDTTTGNIAFNSAYFVDAANHDYRLIYGSTPIDSAVSLSSIFTTDALGVTRPQGVAWDYGAYEFVFDLNRRKLTSRISVRR
jgi:hypothetical protein